MIRKRRSRGSGTSAWTARSEEPGRKCPCKRRILGTLLVKAARGPAPPRGKSSILERQLCGRGQSVGPRALGFRPLPAPASSSDWSWTRPRRPGWRFAGPGQVRLELGPPSTVSREETVGKRPGTGRGRGGCGKRAGIFPAAHGRRALARARPTRRPEAVWTGRTFSTSSWAHACTSPVTWALHRFPGCFSWWLRG